MSVGRRTYGNDAQTGLGKWSDSCELQSRWTDVPFTELNVIGWHFPPCLVDKTAEKGPENEGKAHLVEQCTGNEKLRGVIRRMKVTSIASNTVRAFPVNASRRIELL